MGGHTTGRSSASNTGREAEMPIVRSDHQTTTSLVQPGSSADRTLVRRVVVAPAAAASDAHTVMDTDDGGSGAGHGADGSGSISRDGEDPTLPDYLSVVQAQMRVLHRRLLDLQVRA